MTKTSHRREGLTFQEKVRLWLEENADAGREPSSVRSLATQIGRSQPLVRRALLTARSDPKLSVARAIAVAMQKSLDYLAGPDQLYPQTGEARWLAFVRALSPGQRDAIASTLSDQPKLLALLAAYRAEALAGPAGARRPRG